MNTRHFGFNVTWPGGVPCVLDLREIVTRPPTARQAQVVFDGATRHIVFAGGLRLTDGETVTVEKAKAINAALSALEG